MMTRGERARQFIPFDAMKGLQEALREKERLHERRERSELSEDQTELNDRELNALASGDSVRMLVYEGFAEKTVEGMIDELNRPGAYMRIGPQTIAFSDICRLEKLG